jgi:hypothetical protein
VHGPSEITDGGIGRIGNQHVSVGPVPDSVKLVLLVHLDGDHHPIGHALGAGVFIGDVSDVSERAVSVASDLIVDGLMVLVSVEELLESCIDLSPTLLLAMPLLGE